MNSEQARFILRAFRPGVDRHDAPEFAAAFDQLRQDPQLAAWFEREMAADAVLRGKLSEAVVFPPGLKNRLIASARVTRPGPEVGWRRPALLALAASVVLLLTLGVLYLGRDRNRPEAFAAFRETVVSAGQEGPHISFMDSDPTRIREHLLSRRAPGELALPAGLREASFMGCRILEWNGRKVSLVCFHLKDGEHVDLFVVRDVVWDPTGPGTEPRLARVGSLNTVSWSRNGLTYVLAAETTDAALKRLISA